MDICLLLVLFQTIQPPETRTQKGMLKSLSGILLPHPKLWDAAGTSDMKADLCNPAANFGRDVPFPPTALVQSEGMSYKHNEIIIALWLPLSENVSGKLEDVQLYLGLEMGWDATQRL